MAAEVRGIYIYRHGMTHGQTHELFVLLCTEVTQECIQCVPVWGVQGRLSEHSAVTSVDFCLLRCSAAASHYSF